MRIKWELLKYKPSKKQNVMLSLSKHLYRVSNSKRLGLLLRQGCFGKLSMTFCFVGKP